jgi:uncharacterized protein
VRDATSGGSGVFTTGVKLLQQRIDAVDWTQVREHLDRAGWAVIRGVLEDQQCRAIAALYEAEAGFRSHIVMSRHGFGQGEYRYFSYPLPAVIQSLRTSLYERLAPVANAWNTAMGVDVRFPDSHAEFLERCHNGGQTRPTPLLLRYGPGDYNCLHQDVYGEYLFPMQVTFLLAQPGQDFEGGEFVLVEQRPRMQSRASVVPLALGDGVIFAVNQRPAQGSRGTYRVTLRHGVSELRAGQRHTLGIIFHDAQ